MQSKGNHKQNKEAAQRMGENICEESNKQGINLQNTHTTYAYLYLKKDPIKNKQKI